MASVSEFVNTILSRKGVRLLSDLEPKIMEVEDVMLDSKMVYSVHKNGHVHVVMKDLSDASAPGIESEYHVDQVDIKPNGSFSVKKQKSPQVQSLSK